MILLPVLGPGDRVGDVRQAVPEPDLFEMAAAYLHHLAQNHPFLGGNKRVALPAALILLWMNDVEIFADEDALTDPVMGVAEGRVSKAEVAVFLKAH